METYKTIEELPPYAQDEVKREEKRIEEGKKSKYDILRAINGIGLGGWVEIVIHREEGRKVTEYRKKMLKEIKCKECLKLTKGDE